MVHLPRIPCFRIRAITWIYTFGPSRDRSVPFNHPFNSINLEIPSSSSSSNFQSLLWFLQTSDPPEILYGFLNYAFSSALVLRFRRYDFDSLIYLSSPWFQFIHFIRKFILFLIVVGFFFFFPFFLFPLKAKSYWRSKKGNMYSLENIVF